MATTYKTLLADDITPVRSKLHEAIPITGTIISEHMNNLLGQETLLTLRIIPMGCSSLFMITLI